VALEVVLQHVAVAEGPLTKWANEGFDSLVEAGHVPVKVVRAAERLATLNYLAAIPHIIIALVHLCDLRLEPGP
jgi:hypothetical protein